MKNLVVFINKADAVDDKEMLDLVSLFNVNCQIVMKPGFEYCKSNYL